MSDSIYPIFIFLAELPVTVRFPFNFWFWFMLAGAPALVFFRRIESSVLSHMVRVLCAIGLVYGLMNLALHAKRAFDWRDFEACQASSVHPYMSREMHEECRHHINTADGTQKVFTLLYGWVFAAIYVGLCEIVWRAWHRKRIKALGSIYTGRWFSNIVMLFIFSPIVLFFYFWLI